MNMCLEPYGARYLDPKTSRWLSTDPAMGDYIPGAPINDEVRKRNGNLPGMGGVFNVVNLHTYHYAGNNPVKYMDPDGRTIIDNTTEHHIIIRGSDGETHIVKPGEKYDTTEYEVKEIDGILMPDGSTYKILDGNEKATLTVNETKDENGRSSFTVTPDKEGEKVNKNGDRMISINNALPFTRNREHSGMYKRGDGSQAGRSWWNKAQGDLEVNWVDLPDHEVWNSTLSGFKDKNPNGKK